MELMLAWAVQQYAGNWQVLLAAGLAEHGSDPLLQAAISPVMLSMQYSAQLAAALQAMPGSLGQLPRDQMLV